jgi:hypothetical protein
MARGRWPLADGQQWTTWGGRLAADGQGRTAKGGQLWAVENRKQKNSNYHYLAIQTFKTAKNLIIDLIYYKQLHFMGRISKKV